MRKKKLKRWSVILHASYCPCSECKKPKPLKKSKLK